jgi:hypothetical protein
MTDTIRLTNDTEVTIGCWIDGGLCNVPTGNTRVVSIAESHGHSPQPAYGASEESLHEEAVTAEDFLNGLAPDGYWIGWNDGDFGLWQVYDIEFAVARNLLEGN